MLRRGNVQKYCGQITIRSKYLPIKSNPNSKTNLAYSIDPFAARRRNVISSEWLRHPSMAALSITTSASRSHILRFCLTDSEQIHSLLFFPQSGQSGITFSLLLTSDLMTAPHGGHELGPHSPHVSACRTTLESQAPMPACLSRTSPSQYKRRNTPHYSNKILALGKPSQKNSLLQTYALCRFVETLLPDAPKKSAADYVLILPHAIHGL